ncbi:MAG: universal stress protein [Bacillota bacterium]|nr:universal stress protein [Bacillota bacterium]
MKKILLPIDGSARSLRSIQMAKQFYRPEEAEITILTVLPGETRLDPDRKRKTQEELDAWANLLKEYRVTTAIRQGFPGPEIVRFAENGFYDAILMTRASRNSQHKLGSVASYIVREVPYLDVLVMHEDKN